MVNIGNSWDALLKEVFESAEYQKLRGVLAAEYRRGVVYPSMGDIFNALKLTDYADTKAVILGQDPYHGAGQAHGLSFSVQEGITPPPSLVNIFKELESDLGIKVQKTKQNAVTADVEKADEVKVEEGKEGVVSGDLTKWAKEGVLLLNASLTVRQASPMSHANIGWTYVTDNIIKILGAREKPLVFILWGRFARQKRSLITNPKHLVLESAHPSPLSAHAGFFGSKPFSKTNAFLEKNEITPIDWQL